MKTSQQQGTVCTKKVNKKQVHAQPAPSDPHLAMLNPNAAGVDIASEKHWVCVPADRATPNVRTFGTFTCDLRAIADWLTDCGITRVAMESTGVYRIPLYQVLEERGFQVCLVNAKHLKNVSNRPKTDRLDCQWIQRLHAYGLLLASFRPPDDICRLRTIQRHRDTLIRQARRHIQHMQKALQQMTVRLDTVLSDITGVTGLAILQRILDGERNPVELAKLRDPHVKSSAEEMVKALEGDYREDHLVVLRQALTAYRFTQQQTYECDRALEHLLGDLPNTITTTHVPLPPATQNHLKPRRNDDTFDARTTTSEVYGVDLTQVPGIQAATALIILTELGQDWPAKWPTEKHFTSWLGVAPNLKRSGGKDAGSQTRKVQSRAARAFRMAARATGHSKTALGAFYQRMKTRLGGPQAITATARKLAVIVYHMVTTKTPYQAVSETAYLNQQRQHVLKKLKRQARSFGLDLVPQSPTAETP